MPRTFARALPPLAFPAVLWALLGCSTARPVAPPPEAETPSAPEAAAPLEPPRAERRPHRVVAPHGAARDDEYYWLRDDQRKDPEVLAYLRAENEHTDRVLAPLAPLKERLFEELVSRVKQDEASVPYQQKGYWYYTRWEEGREHPIHARKKGSLEAAEEVVLDVNRLAEGHAFYQLARWEPSPSQRLVAFAADSVGRRQFVLRVKDTRSGELLPDAIPGASAGLMWGDDEQTLYYIENDPETLLGRRVKAHVLGTPVAEDRLIYEEPDPSFYLAIRRTRSERYLCIHAESTVASELRCAPAARPGAFQVLAPRQRDVEYSADHFGGRWVILTNWDAVNNRLMSLSEREPWGDRRRWKELVAHRSEVMLTGFQLFEGFMAIGERAEGLQRIRLRPDRGPERLIAAEEPAYAMSLGVNAEPQSTQLRYTYTSLTTPLSTLELDVKSGARRLLHEREVPGYDKRGYVTERRWITARDGTAVPVTLLYRRGFVPDGSGALFLYGYGSYGSSLDPFFDATALSLVDRGVVYALAHVRGGREMGRGWYDRGKLKEKMNTFTDFIDVTRALVEAGYAAPGRVAARGGSAGGLLMGAVANMAPELYRAIVAQVPFVDVVTTMLDASIPLTTNEWDEWGDPREPDAYAYMLSYSPYDQVEAKAYPAMLVTTGLWDSQVQYFEPAKWVARLRAKKTDREPLLLRIDMEAGHGGKAGRFQRFREKAEVFAFVLERLGLDAR